VLKQNKEHIMEWLKARLAEASTLDGTVILAISAAAFFSAPFVKLLAAAGAAYGAYRMISKSKGE